MKSIFFYVILCLGIIVAQTTVLRPPYLPPVIFDLLIPVVVFARLNLPMRISLSLALITGFVMDLFSGGQFGVYISIYLWIFLGVTGVSSYFNLQGNRFRSILIAGAVFMENLLCCLFATFPYNIWLGLLERIDMVLWQVILAGITGPVVVSILEHVQKQFAETQLEKKKNTVSLWMTDI